MSSGRPTFRRMINEVVKKGTCSECGTCVVVCPYDVLQYEKGKPIQTVIASMPDLCVVSETIDCDVCAAVCPRLEPSIEALDRLFFGRERTEEEQAFGVYREVVMARTTDERVMHVCQDGGVVTALLGWALAQGRIDGAIVSGTDPQRRWIPLPKAVRTFEDLLASGGSRYTYSPNPLAMLDAAKRNLGRLALVGTPCEVSPVGKARLAKLHEYGDRIDVTIGLLCSEAFTYEGLMEQQIQGEMGIDLDEVVKVNIKGKVLVYLKSGEVREIPLKDAKLHARPECSFCADFSAEHADIAAGGIGIDGWTVAILRSQAGAEMLAAAAAAGVIEVRPIDEFPGTLDLLARHAKRQRRHAQRSLAALQE
ncbi:MAG: Coenzyme F420 hydrogenase/dehydrogenase, beta subunit C-terminal domain [Chloroflexi bacterium]|nr:Coenzyme F420 hydrogenase/dehydrogenase, beta subunit C-terminal domain [Chloroflexota bacterium]